jgi:hypothetical protein
MKQKYRIMGQHCTDPPEVHSEQEFEAESLVRCNQKALEHFNKLADDPSHIWTAFRLSRIVVVERETELAFNAPNADNPRSVRATILYNELEKKAA